MLFLFFTHFLIASTYSIIKLALEQTTPYVLVTVRLLLGGGFLVLLHPLSKIKNYWRDSYFRKTVLNLVFILAYIPYMCEYWSMVAVSSIKACLLYNLAPFITAIIAHFIIHSRITTRQWIAIIIGFIGSIPILLQDNDSFLLGMRQKFSFAELIILVAVIVNAYGWIIVEDVQQKKGYPPLLLNGIAMFGGGVVAALHTFFVSNTPLISGTTSLFWGYTIALTVASTMGSLLYSHMLNRYSATFVSLTALSTPVFGALFSYFLLNEALTPAFFVTMIIVSGALILFYSDESIKNES